MVAVKAGGNNLPGKGEQGFKKSKVGKTAPTASSLPKMGLLKNNDQGEPEVVQFYISEYTNADLVTAPGVTVEDLFGLAKYGNAEVRQRVAEQENISLKTFDLLILDNNYDVLKSLAGNANLPKEHFRPLFDKVINAEYLYFTPEVHTYHTLAGQKTSSPPLGEYAIDEEKKTWFKAMILSNRHGLAFDASVLDELREDPSSLIRELVVANRNIPTVWLKKMASTDKKRRVRKAAREEINKREWKDSTFNIN